MAGALRSERRASDRMAHLWQLPCSFTARGGRPMLKNATYNLMETATVISKGLHRYETFVKDAGDCQHCKEIWNHMKRTDEELLQRLVTHMRQHLDRDEGAQKAA
jgi:hypothetical protein